MQRLCYATSYLRLWLSKKASWQFMRNFFAPMTKNQPCAWLAKRLFSILCHYGQLCEISSNIYNLPLLDEQNLQWAVLIKWTKSHAKGQLISYLFGFIIFSKCAWQPWQAKRLFSHATVVSFVEYHPGFMNNYFYLVKCFDS